MTRSLVLDEKSSLRVETKKENDQANAANDRLTPISNIFSCHQLENLLHFISQLYDDSKKTPDRLMNKQRTVRKEEESESR